jgi:hypothetical protein
VALRPAEAAMQSSDVDTEYTQSAMKAVVLTAQIGAATEEGKRVHPELERVSTLVQHVHKQLQQIPRGAEPDALRPIASVLGATLGAVRGMCSLRPNRHGYYYHALYSRELGHAERRLGQLVPILASQMVRRPAETAAAAAMDHADQPAVFEIISDALARAFWRVAFGRNVVEVPIGQFFACIERMVDGGDWLNFACLSGALDQLRSGRVELAAFASFVEREGGLVRGLHKFATAPTMIYACGSNRMGECGQAAMVQDHIVSPAAVGASTPVYRSPFAACHWPPRRLVRRTSSWLTLPDAAALQRSWQTALYARSRAIRGSQQRCWRVVSCTPGARTATASSARVRTTSVVRAARPG